MDGWIDDRTGKGRNSVEINREVGDGVELVSSIQDVRAGDPKNLIGVDSEQKQRILTASEIGNLVMEDLPEDYAKVLMDLIKRYPNVGLGLDVGPEEIVERLAIIRPRIKDGRLLVPKKVVGISVKDGVLKITYRQGYSDDKVNQALYWYSRGVSAHKIDDLIGVGQNTVDYWLYRCMGLPSPRKLRRWEALRLYDGGMRPVRIAEVTGLDKSSVYHILEQERGVILEKSGVDPYVYEVTGFFIKPYQLQSHLSHKNMQAHQRLLELIIEFQGGGERGPTWRELRDCAKYDPQHHLDNLVDVGVLHKRKYPKERLYR